MTIQLSKEEIQERILYTFDLYPAMSLAMLNTMMINYDPRIWRDVFYELLDNGQLSSKNLYSTTPGGQARSYTIYFKPAFDYNEYYETHVTKNPDTDSNAA